MEGEGILHPLPPVHLPRSVGGGCQPGECGTPQGAYEPNIQSSSVIAARRKYHGDLRTGIVHADKSLLSMLQDDMIDSV